MTWEIVRADVMEWAESYTGEPFHACLCDPPYSINFMSKKWDGDIAFQPATWAAIARHLHPGAWMLAFASTRGWHRLACAVEDAGYIIQPSVFVEGVGVVDCAPMVGWLSGQSFPKATRIKGYPEFNGHRYGGQPLKNVLEPIIAAQMPWGRNRLDDIVETGAGSLWIEGGRVAAPDHPGVHRYTGDCFSLISKGKAKGQLSKCSPRTGRWPPNYAVCHHELCERVLESCPCPACHGDGGNGRAPAVSGTEPCDVCGGTGMIEVGAVERVKGNPGGTFQPVKTSKGHTGGSFGNPLCLKPDGHSKSSAIRPNHADPDGTEPVPRYRCARHCPVCGGWWLSETATACPECGDDGEWACSVRRLDEQAGERRSAGNYPTTYNKSEGGYGRWAGKDTQGPLYEDKGGPSRFYVNPSHALDRAERPFWQDASERLALGDVRKYASKSSRAERDAGLDETFSLALGPECGVRTTELGKHDGYGAPRRNSHPTVKPLALTRWLATLLLPPPEYAPRRLLIPFAGTGSEAIGALLAGWDEVVMIEQNAEYCTIAEARCKWWAGWSERTGETEPKAVLKAARKAERIAKANSPQQLEIEML